jgi:hypothetical protein
MVSSAPSSTNRLDGVAAPALGKYNGKHSREGVASVFLARNPPIQAFCEYSLREIFARKAEISLRGPEATKTGASENASGDRAKKSVERSRSAGGGATELWALIQRVDWRGLASKVFALWWRGATSNELELCRPITATAARSWFRGTPHVAPGHS